LTLPADSSSDALAGLADIAAGDAGFDRDMFLDQARAAFAAVKQAVAARDLTERWHAEERLLRALELERKRIADDIHDDSLQAVTAASLRLQLLRQSLEDPSQLLIVSTLEELLDCGRRAGSLLRAFNLRCGIGPELEFPSPRYGGVPSDGPAQGVDAMPVWEQMRDVYYARMQWDRATGKPLAARLVEIAALATYLASDESRFTTGTCCVIDGGWSN